MRRLENLLSRRWLTVYACALCVLLAGVALALFSEHSFSFVLIGLGSVVMFCVLILVEWRGLE